MVRELFRGALIEHARQRPHRLVRLVVLLVLAVHLLADRGTRLTTGPLFPGSNGFLVELSEVVVNDELVVHFQPLLFRSVDTAVVEGQELSAQSRVIDPESTTRFETRLKAVFGGGLEILGLELLVILVHEPLVSNLSVPEILVDKRAAVDDRGNVVILEELGAETSPSRPGVRVGKSTVDDRNGADGAEVGDLGCRPDDQNPRISRVLVAKAIQHVVNQGVDTSASPVPNSMNFDGKDLHLDFLSSGAIKSQDRGSRGPTYD